MNRRSFLSTFGGIASVAVAGCTGTLTGQSGVSPPADQPSKYPSLSVRADPMRADGYAVTVSVVEGFDETGPARIRIELTNRADDEQTTWFGVTPPFTDLWGERVDGTGSAVLIPLDKSRIAEVIPETPTNGTWQATTDFGINATAIQIPLAPEESVSRTYAFLAAVDSKGLPPGEYRFEQRDYAGDGTWGFTVVVSY